MSHISKQKSSYADHLIPMRIEIYSNDVKIKYTTYDAPGKHKHGEKSKITELSRRSLALLVFTVQNTDVKFRTMVTLTYPGAFPENGKECKKHLNRFLMWAKNNGIGSYVWFLEFQKRGAPHFHLLASGTLEKTAVSSAWFNAVGSNDHRHMLAGTRVEMIRDADGAGKYAAKYGAKKEQKKVPEQFADVGRFWGSSRDVKPTIKKSIDITGTDIEAIADTLEGMGWEYHQSLRDAPLSTLYNASVLFA